MSIPQGVDGVAGVIGLSGVGGPPGAVLYSQVCVEYYISIL